MSEVKIEKAKPASAEMTREMAPFRDFLAPMFPAGRFFGVSPFAMMRQFGEEMDRMFKGTPSAPAAWSPAVDVQRSNGNLVVTAELPGLKKEEIKVEMTEDALTITGERKREQEESHEGYHTYERSYGKFYRSIPLPENARPAEAKAELNNGVLKISLPAPVAKVSVRQIPVQEASEKKPVAA
ncbi:MAG: Hsp20/alpha crystallin family protein [Acidobacteriota bacterium]|nr:Hsp20/alpha crystallin family protein [Acidobacteriota bacterium]